MRTIQEFGSVVNLRTLVVAGLSVASTYLCARMAWEAEIPTGLIGLAVVFPIVCSINAAYRRREEVLRYFGAIKAHAVALYYAQRDWVPGAAGPESPHASAARENVERLLRALRQHFSKHGGRSQETFQAVYSCLSQISLLNERMRDAGVPANEISRANQYLSKLSIDFERMGNYLDYRTPRSLRAYSRVFLTAFPILFGPYFAHLSQRSYPAAGYVVAVLYSMVLVSLDNIQSDLEDPYDEVGTDDVKLDVVQRYTPVVNE
jgi:predicted membrane chloride channel (bestrophin family)